MFHESASTGGTPQYHILIVDDNAALGLLWARMARLNGYAADVAGDGAEAMARIAERRYDVIICDLHMPVLNGRQVFDACRQRFPQQADRMIFVTGAWYPDAADMVLDTGRPCLIKAFEWGVLEHMMQEVLRGNETAAE